MAESPSLDPHQPAAEQEWVERLQLRDLAARLREASPRTWVSQLLLAANVLVYLGQQGMQTFASLGEGVPDAMVLLGANYGPLSLGEEPWRLLTSCFLHGGWLHLIFNSVALYQLGRIAERLFGAPAFLILYLFSGLCGSLLSAGWGLQGEDIRLGVGASGAVFGIIGALIVGWREAGVSGAHPAIRQMRRQMMSLAILNLLIGLTPGIDNAAHLGGFLGGIVAGTLLRRTLPPDRLVRQRQLRSALFLVVCWGALFYLARLLLSGVQPTG